MKSPWVWRALYDTTDRAFSEMCAAHNRLSDQLDRERDRYDALLAKYHELRVQGANVPEKLPDAPKSPLVAIGPKTVAALREMSVGLPNTVRRSMEASALALHAEGLKDAEVAAAVRAGEPARNGNGR